MATSTESPLLTSLKTDGFVIVPSVLSADELEALRAAAGHIASIARSGDWPHIRTVGKQFPPWESTPPPAGIWGVQHLLHPKLPVTEDERAAFARLYFSDKILGVAKELLSCADDELVMELCNMLVRPETPFELRWHRDDIGPDVSPEEEVRRLAEPAWHAQWNLALYDDDSLVVVPGSHLRARTETERNADPFAEQLPGMLKVQLKPGDVAFYNNNILHRGVYDSSRERMTPHGSIGHVAGSTGRARNVLQHGVAAFVDRCDFSVLGETGQERADGMRERLIRMGQQSGDVGYSLSG